jgi:hypothetical protein
MMKDEEAVLVFSLKSASPFTPTMTGLSIRQVKQRAELPYLVLNECLTVRSFIMDGNGVEVPARDHESNFNAGEKSLSVRS